MTTFWSDLLPNVNANISYNIQSYGYSIQSNKEFLSNACTTAQITYIYCVLMFAMAMQESNLMAASYHDDTKDQNTDGSRNFSMFNLNQSLIEFLGFGSMNNGKLSLNDLNDPTNICVVLNLVQYGFLQLGVEGMLSFVRGGKPGCLNSQYGVDLFLQAIATILSLIDKQPSLLYDNRRVDIDVFHV